MESQAMFLDCPAYLDEHGHVRCGLPAEVKSRFIMSSTDGPLESVMIRCPVGHIFKAPIEFLSLERQPDNASAARNFSDSYQSHTPGGRPANEHPEAGDGSHPAISQGLTAQAVQRSDMQQQRKLAGVRSDHKREPEAKTQE